MASSVRRNRSAAVGSILKLLGAIALELVSCVEARMPIPPERIEAMRAFEHDLKVECGERTRGSADAWGAGYAFTAASNHELVCTGLLE
jgi:hypothetical protein